MDLYKYISPDIIGKVMHVPHVNNFYTSWLSQVLNKVYVILLGFDVCPCLFVVLLH